MVHPGFVHRFVRTVNKIILFLDDGVIAADEFRYNCVTRIPVDNVNILDEAYQNLLNVRSYDGFLKIARVDSIPYYYYFYYFYS